MTLKELQVQSHGLSVAKGFWEGQDRGPFMRSNTAAEKLLLIITEAVEAVEEVRAGRPNLYFGDGGKPEGLAAELADVVIRVADLAEAAGIDLDSVIQAKHAYNERRPDKHGKLF